MLRKPPSARPTLERCLKVLTELKTAQKNNNLVNPLMDEAAKQVAEIEAREEAERQAEVTLRHERNELFKDAKTELLAIKERLFSSLKDSSESIKFDHNGQLQFGKAKLDIKSPEILDESIARLHSRSGKPYQSTGWDVLGWSIVAVTCYVSKNSPYTWSASLLFADRKDGNGFRWYEVSFWRQSDMGDAPLGLEGYEVDIDLALGHTMHIVNVAYGPFPIDGEDEASFISRWTGLVAKAAIGQLTMPRGMPIHDFD